MVGWIGSIAFAVCSIPQAYHCFKVKNANGISWGLIILSLVGEVCSLVYVLPMGHIPLILNYLSNLFFMSVIGYYKAFGIREVRKTL